MRRAVVLALLPLLAACRSSSSGATASGTAAAGLSVSTAVPAGYPASAFRVPAPLLFVGTGVPGPELPPCSANRVVARAGTLRTTDGVAGVIRLDAPDCRLDVRQGPTEVLDAEGHQLAIPWDPVSAAVNPPMSRSGYEGLAAGHALWGFAIDGSWCGMPPASIVIPLTASASTAQVTDLTVPLTGPLPACNGQSNAELRPGTSGISAIDGQPAEAVLPAPQEWSGLRLTLHVASVSGTGDLVQPSATISNPTHTAISLSPCPSYEMVVTEGNGESVGEGTFGCDTPRVVPAGGSVNFLADGQGFGSGDPDIKPGGPVTVQLAIAGAPTAKVTTRVG